MKTLHFYAFREDILPILKVVEDSDLVHYVKMGRFQADQLFSYSNAVDIPNLGIATDDSAIGCDTYLVLDSKTQVCSRFLPGNRNFQFIDQLANPDSITFSWGGIWRDTTLLNGRIATISETAHSKRLMKLFTEPIKKQFSKAGTFFLGSRADQLLQNGGRLTISIQSPPAYDLQPPKLNRSKGLSTGKNARKTKGFGGPEN